MPNHVLYAGFYCFKNSISKSKKRERLEKPNLKELKEEEINDEFPDEFLMSIKTDEKESPWFTDFANYLVGGILRKGLTYAHCSSNLYTHSSLLHRIPAPPPVPPRPPATTTFISSRTPPHPPSPPSPHTATPSRHHTIAATAADATHHHDTTSSTPSPSAVTTLTATSPSPSIASAPRGAFGFDSTVRVHSGCSQTHMGAFGSVINDE
ncbi:hypothetical protein Tco_0246343 [Tanacetum coccineum]